MHVSSGLTLSTVPTANAMAVHTHSNAWDAIVRSCRGTHSRSCTVQVCVSTSGAKRGLTFVPPHPFPFHTGASFVPAGYARETRCAAPPRALSAALSAAARVVCHAPCAWAFFWSTRLASMRTSNGNGGGHAQRAQSSTGVSLVSPRSPCARSRSRFVRWEASVDAR